MEERIKKWRLILGQKADKDGDTELSGEAQGMDAVLEALYDSDRKKGLGSSSPRVNRWLGDIRKYFPKSVVKIMQKDALERLNMDQMLFEPELLEDIEADVDLIGTLLSLKSVIPEKTKATARKIVQKVVEDLQKRLKFPMQEAIRGAMNRSVINRKPKFHEIDWHKTIRLNLKHYQHDYKTIIPEQLRGYGKSGRSMRHVIMLVDQSGSMANSIVYSGIFGAVMASIASIKTHLVVFDTSVVDLTDKLDDPVELLFSTQLGGGTDINKALGYCQTLVANPNQTIIVLISDLFEGGNATELLRKVANIQANGVQFICLLSLSDEGAPIYDKDIAQKIANLGIPSFACTPDQFPSLMAAAIEKQSIEQWMNQMGKT